MYQPIPFFLTISLIYLFLFVFIYCFYSRSRVTPTKFVYIPRLELAAAALSIRVSVMLRKELSIHCKIKDYFWTDSQVVWSYINNNSKRFKIFEANRFQLIKQNSNVGQCMYMNQSLIRQMIYSVVYLHLTRRKSNVG